VLAKGLPDGVSPEEVRDIYMKIYNSRREVRVLLVCGLVGRGGGGHV
jgi:hypothetical protein